VTVEAKARVYGAMYPSLKNRVVLITGGGSGIGEDITRHFLEQGSRVAFIDIAEEASRALLAQLADKGHAPHYEDVDLTDINALRAAIGRVRAALGPIEILINNAANDQRVKLEDVTPEYWDDRMAVNLKHQFFCAQAVLGDMIAAGGGSIVNIGSFAYDAGFADVVPYLAAKSGVIGLTRGLAFDYGKHNIRVNCVMPGWIMTKRALENWVGDEGRRTIDLRQCLKRGLEPREVAKVVLFYASDESSACTRQSYLVDGGWV
jgi:NAD(P)-dependent dehydrogenase (short-subunit alcohol dehydrogenase family)